MPVVNKEGLITGMLSRLDVFKIITAKTPDWKRFKGQNVKVSDINMSEILWNGIFIQ
jgi:hypothetical protein